MLMFLLTFGTYTKFYLLWLQYETDLGQFQLEPLKAKLWEEEASNGITRALLF